MTRDTNNTNNNSQTFDSDFSPPTVELKEGQSLGENKNYTLEQNLGVNRIGEVWLASELRGGVGIRKVVVKTLRPDRRENEGTQEKALKHFQLIQTLNHTNICPIYVIEKDPACGYLVVMGYANGGSYADWFKNQPKQNGGIPLMTVCKVLRPIANALDHAHQFGVIHSDVKPENMMFTMLNGVQTSWLINFGSSQFQTEKQAKTGSSQSGMVSCMAPEQRMGQPQTAQTDEYSLAMVALEFLTGTTFMQAAQALQLEIQRVLSKALALKPSNRFPTCVAFIDALEKTALAAQAKPASTSNGPTNDLPKPKGGIQQIVESARLLEEAKRRAEEENLKKRIRAFDIAAAEEYKSGNYAKAIAYLNEILKLRPDLPNAKWLLNEATQKLAIQESQRKAEWLDHQRKALENAVQQENERKAAEKGKHKEHDLKASEVFLRKNWKWIALGGLVFLVFLGVLFSSAKTRQSASLEETTQEAEDAPLVEEEKKVPDAEDPAQDEMGLDRFVSGLPVSETDSGTTLPASVQVGSAAGDRKILTVDGIDYPFRWCPPGEFMMGSKSGSYDEKPVHKVQMTKGFWMLETEVTQEMWESVMVDNPSEFKGARNPVENVSWDDCREFCRRLSEKLGQKIQFPTEAQWEYACRAGTTGNYAGELDSMAWYHKNSGSTSHEVGQKTPNDWGLYDMHGNVWEWCSDWYEDRFYDRTPTNNPENVSISASRVVHGGAWNSAAGFCRSSDRFWNSPDFRDKSLGLRVALIPIQEKQAGDRKVLTVDGIDYAFRWCPPGEFMMGAANGENDEKPIHKVNLTKGFWMLETEVTQAMWQSVMGSNPSEFKGDQNPVECVSWDDCQFFCRKLSQKLGQQVQLPTEAQWEYACRAGTTGDFAGKLDSMAWHSSQSGVGTHEAGQRMPNQWGLYDMEGNVWEWCSDWYEDRYYDRSPTNDPENTTTATLRVMRGGSWDGSAQLCRSADRGVGNSGVRNGSLGFRVVVIPPPEKQAGERKVMTVDGITYAFRWCPPGEFMMGGNGYDEEKPLHRVVLTIGFWMLETEVTQAMWQSVMGEEPSDFKGNLNPVEKVSWDECQVFCQKLSQKLGQQVQLPTEAQWEYACRAGTAEDSSWDMDSIAWHKGNSASRTHPVGQKKPNSWGFYDMFGNVWEWCSDYFDPNYFERSPVNNPENTTDSPYHTIRGIGWALVANDCRPAIRNRVGPGYRCNDLGLRVVLLPEQD